ncbi:MAG: hypothetical protein IPL32_18085 [Chloracidobacterium sp.]|nr:hypothetical protein [Chloracidobacterium sp.]
MITIDGVSFDIPVVKINRKADFLDKYAERLENGYLARELIGVFLNYTLEFGRTNNTTEYAALWDKLTEPVEFHTVSVPDGDGTMHTFTAYFSGVADELQKRNDAKTFWKRLTVNFIAKSPARIPE